MSLRAETVTASPEHSAMIEPAPVDAKPTRRQVFVAEIVCLLCGRQTGTAVAERWPPTGAILFQPADAKRLSPVRAWWRIRCAVCGGNTAATEIETRIARLEPPVDWREQRPR